MKILESQVYKVTLGTTESAEEEFYVKANNMQQVIDIVVSYMRENKFFSKIVAINLWCTKVLEPSTKTITIDL